MTTTRETLAAAGMRPLRDLPDFEVAEGDPDIRGWTVVDAAGQPIGRVRELYVAPQSMDVRFIEVDVGGTAEQLLLPVERTSVDAARQLLVAPEVNSQPVAPAQGATIATSATAAPAPVAPVAAAASTPVTVPAPASAPAPITSAADTTRVTRSEEELAVGTRTVNGEVGIHKTVDTEHVAQPVTTTRETVSVERQAPSESAVAGGPVQVGEGEIRIPVVEERIVVEKRPVVVEEIVVRTHQVTEEQIVEADLKKERVEVERTDVPPGRS